jgi:sugar phosphate isomerase/epimerase
MSAIAILRPIMVRLAEGSRRPRQYYTIVWRGPRGEESAGLHYSLSNANDMARECGAKEIIIEEGAGPEASPAPRLADMTYEDIQELREEAL